jgi:hypothetical protein
MEDYRKVILNDPELDKGQILSELFNLAKIEQEDADLEPRNVPYVLKEKQVLYAPIDIRKRTVNNRY